MDPPEDGRSGGGLEDETAARKRARRVSFAETTAVHVFDRDDDFDTPPDGPSPKPPTGGEDHSLAREEHVSEEEEDEEEDEEEEQERFVRNMLLDSSSPGSAAGSATSNDDDNFFGPVSASFIKPGRFSDSGMSEDNNHDITLDSTAFSLHFREIAPPGDYSGNSAGSLRTPMGYSMTIDHESLMDPSGMKKPIPKSMLSGDKTSSSTGNSNCMSLLVANPNRYDYGKFSPTMEAFMAEVKKSMEDFQNIKIRDVASNHHVNGLVNAEDGGREEMQTCVVAAQSDKLNDAVSDSDLLNVSVDGTTTCHINANSLTEDSPNTKSRDVASNSHVSKLADAEDGGKEEIQTCVAAAHRDELNDAASDSDLLNVSADGITTGNINADLLTEMRAGHVVDTLVNSRTKGMISPVTKESSRNPHEANLSSTVALHIQNSNVLPSPKRTCQDIIVSKSDHDPQDSLRIHGSGFEFYPGSPKVFPRVSEMMIADDQQQLFGADHGMHTPKNAFQSLQPPLQESISSLRAKRQRLFSDSASGSKLPHTPAGGQHPYLYEIELKRHGERISAIKNSISKSKIPDSPRGFISRSALLGKDLMSLNFSSNLDKMTDGLDISAAAIKEDSANFNKKAKTQESGDLSCSLLETPMDISVARKSEENIIANGTVTPLGSVSPFHSSTKMQNPLTFSNSSKTALMPSVGSSQRKDKPDSQESSPILNNSLMIISSSLQVQEQNLPVSQVGFFSPKVDAVVSSSLFHGVIGIQVSPSDSNKVGKVHSPKKTFEMNTHIRNFQIGLGSCQPAHFDDQDKRVGHHTECNAEVHNVELHAPPKHWADILAKASEVTKQVFAPSIVSLNSQQMDVLEDLLDEIQTVRKYEKLCSEIQYLKRHDELGDHQKRVAQVRFLQERLAFERAKIQLKRVKLDRLHIRANQFQSGIEECQKLKPSLMHALFGGAGAAQNMKEHLYSVTNYSSSENQEQHKRVAALEQDFEMLDQKTRRLMKFFENSSKITKNMKCDELIKAVSEHLEKKTRCRAIHQYLQLWELSDIMNKDDQRGIVLNYLNLLSQRFTINSSPASIEATNFPNDVNIRKNFPNMNAFTAFKFIFKTKDQKRLDSSKYLQQETLVTSLLLGTLFDVLEEVQVARIAIPKLISSTFHSPSSSQLELQLSFVNLKSGRKVTLDLDMTDLTCAVYPADPSELKITICGAQTTLEPSIFDEIIGAIRILQGGRPMIMRLCQCISQVVDASS